MQATSPRLFPLAFALVIAGGRVGHADIELSDKVSLSGQFRPRLEIDATSFDSAVPVDQYATIRTRLGITVTDPVPHSRFHLLIADSRAMGYSDPYLEGHPIGPNQLDTNLGVVSVYALIDDIVRPGLYLKVGRFDNNQGGNRIFGPGNWNYAGPRTYDGIKAGYRAADYAVNLWSFYGLNGDRHWYPDPAARPEWELPDPDLDYNHDHLLSGLDVRLLAERLQFLAFLDHDAHQVEDAATGEGHAAALRGTVAVYGKWACDQWQEQGGVSMAGNLAYQFGRLGTSGGTSAISAWLATGDVAYSPGGRFAPWGGLGFDLTSGDRNAGAGDTYYFFDYYYSKHSKRGHMDYFKSPTGIAARGLQDLIVRVGAQPVEPIEIQLDAHYFRTMKPFESKVDAAGAHSLGAELDLTTSYRVRGNLTGDLGIDLFLPTADWQGEGTDPTLFVYTTLNLEF